MKTLSTLKPGWIDKIKTKAIPISILVFSLFTFIACNDDEDTPAVLSPGDVAWTLENGMTITAQPIVSGDRVLLEQDGTILQAVDGKTGNVIWSFQGLKFHNIIPGYSFRAPLVNDDVVYWAMAWGNVYAIDLKTGDEIWKYKASTALTGQGVPNESFMVPPVFFNGTLYVLGTHRKLMAIDALTGQLIWKNDAIGSVESPLLLCNDKIIVVDHAQTFRYRALAFDALTGQPAWSYESRNQIHSFLFSDDKYAYINVEGVVIGLEITTGTALYECNTGMVNGRLMFASSKHFFVQHNDNIHAYDKLSKQKIWDYGIARSVYYKPNIHNDQLFVGDTEYLHAVDANSGKLIWKKQLFEYSAGEYGPIEPFTYASTPAIGRQYVYTVHKDKLFAIKW